MPGDKSNGHRGWYYCAEFGSFGGFRYHDSDEMLYAWTGNVWGPFPSFTAAKRDALEYFRNDARIAKEAADEVLAARVGQYAPARGTK
jgi:hypothetical protein